MLEMADDDEDDVETTSDLAKRSASTEVSSGMDSNEAALDRDAVQHELAIVEDAKVRGGERCAKIQKRFLAGIKQALTFDKTFPPPPLSSASSHERRHAPRG